MFSNKMITDKNLNDAEKILILYYQSHTGADNETGNWHFYDYKVIEELKWGKGKLGRTKASLKEKGLLYIEQVSFEKYNYYIGTEAVKKYKEKKD